MFGITLVSYYLSSKYYKPVSDWTNIGYVLYFQPARFLGYAVIFVLGVYANQQKWFTESGWKPSLFYFGISLISIVWLIYWKFNIAASLNTELNLWIDAITYSLISIGMTFGLISVFMTPSITSGTRSLSQLAPYSYGTYWLHQIVAMLVMYYLININLSASIKWSITMIITIISCTLLTKYILKKTPLLKDIF